MEATMAVAGFAIGGRIGAGTLVMGATVGHLFRFWSTRLHRWGCTQSTRSITVALAWPPPSHMVWKP